MKIEFSFSGYEVEIVIGPKGLIAMVALAILCRLDTVLTAIDAITKWVTP